MIINKIQIIFISFLIFSNALIIKSDVTDSDEINSLFWFATQYGLAWDLNSNKVCSNQGITCNTAKTNVQNIYIDINTPTGSVIIPASISTSSISGQTTTTSPTTATTTASTTGSATSGSGTSSSGQTTALSTSIIPSTHAVSPAAIYNVVSPQYRSLQSTMEIAQSTPTPISNLVLIGLKSMTVIGRNTVTNTNILDKISELPELSYLEFSDVLDLTVIPTGFTYYCPKLTTLILKNITATSIPDNLLENGSPLYKLYLDFPTTYFKWEQTNVISDLLINYQETESSVWKPVTIDAFTFQNLTNLVLTTNSRVTIINAVKLRTAIIKCQNNPTNYQQYNFTSNKNVDLISVENCTATQFDFASTTLKQFIVDDGYIGPTVPIVNGYPTGLEILNISNAQFRYLPTLINIPDIKQLLLPNNYLLGQIDGFSNLESIDLSGNQLTGSVPDSFCSNDKINLSGNQFSGVLPNCFLCHWSITQPWFNGNSNPLDPVNGFVCNIVLDQLVYSVISVGETLSLTGTNLGWLNSLSTPGLKMVVPNSLFTFDFPAKQSLNQISQRITFSLDRYFDIQWTYYTLEFTKVDFIQDTTFILVNVTGTFDASCSFTVNGNSVTLTAHDQTYIQFQIPRSTPQGPIKFSLISTKLLNPIEYISIFKYQYPMVTSSSIIEIDKTTNAFIYGIFKSVNQPLIYINEKPCTVVSFNSSVIEFLVPSFPIGGYANITVTDSSYNFTSSKLIYYEKSISIDSPCKNPCENGGTCVSSKCKCIDNFYGPTCSLKKADSTSYQLVTDQTKPLSTFSLSAVSFEFQLFKIQELGFNGQMVQEILIDNWEYQSDKPIDNLGLASQYISNVSNVVVTVSVVDIKQSMEYEFAGTTTQLESGQVKVSMSIENWNYTSSLNTLRAVFKSASISNVQQNDQCQNINGTTNSDTSDITGELLSFTIIRNGYALSGSFINRMLSNGRIAYSNVEDMGSNEIGLNMPQCTVCILDPNYSVLVDPSFSTQDGCDESKSKTWIIAVAVVVPVVFLTFAAVAGFVLFKKHIYIYRDGKTFKISKRRKSKSRFSMSKIG